MYKARKVSGHVLLYFASFCEFILELFDSVCFPILFYSYIYEKNHFALIEMYLRIHKLILFNVLQIGQTLWTLFEQKSKKAISGEARASKDMVKLDVPWPYEFTQNVSVNYSDREFGLIQLVRGEMCI